MGLFKRGKVWWMTFTYQGRQVRRSTETSDRRLAEAILAKTHVKIVEGRYFEVLEERERTFAEMMDRYMKEVSVQKVLRSNSRDQQCLKHHLLPYFGNRTLADVTPGLISGYKAKRQAEEAAPATLHKELGLIKAAFNVAIREWEWCRDNPVRRVAMPRVNNARVRYLSDEEFEPVLAHCPDWLKPIVSVARYTGLRRENIVQLRWCQVDLFRRLILLDRTKNGDRLGIPLCNRAVEVLKSLNRVRHLSGYVFAKPDGNPFKGWTVGVAFSRACRRAGVADFRFHDLRHTFASCLVQRGVDLYRVQRLLGHRDGRMTQRYAHLAPENLRSAVEVQDENYHNFSTMRQAEEGIKSGNA
jgi:integrase